MAAMRDSSAFEQYVEPAERGYRSRHRGIHRGTVADVKRHCGGVSAGRANARGCRFGRGAVDIGAHDRRALATQALGAGPADPTAGADREHRLALDSPHFLSPAVRRLVIRGSDLPPALRQGLKRAPASRPIALTRVGSGATSAESSWPGFRLFCAVCGHLLEEDRATSIDP